MNVNRLLAYLTVLLPLVTFNACQDHQLSPTTPGSGSTRLRVKSLSEELLNNAVKITTFNYDSQGRLSSLLAYQSPDSARAQVERNTYQYNAQNRLILHQRQVITRPGSVLVPFSEQNQFSYNATGQVAEIRYSARFGSSTNNNQTIVDLATLNDISSLQIVVQLRYNALNQLVSSTRANYFQGNLTSLASTNEYGYSGDNLSSISVTTTGNFPTTREQNSLTYDAKINPFYGVYVIPTYFGGVSTNFPNLNTLSRNNITNLGGLTYRYEYNAADLPTARYTAISGRPTQTLRLDYEAY